MIRTTVRLDPELSKEARKKAIDEGIPFTRMINEALLSYLNKPLVKQTRTSDANSFLAGLAGYGAKGLPKDLAQKHDKYTWE